ncbi:uncharacterized protein LOC141648620 [Silene latifolia]|uniref:uncharacterized protein LOC141648620 n=1 Tax=Silene latifolia TaxID=37657 RepID=UPI003D7894B8
MLFQSAWDGSKFFTFLRRCVNKLSRPFRNPELYEEKVKDAGEPAEQENKCVSCNTALSFSDEDLLLGSKLHNRPLYVSGYIRGRRVNRILIDGGSGVNLMPKATMVELGITMDELSSSRTIIHGFNLNGERAVGIIRVNLSMEDLSSDTLFHVIDAKTSFKLLLGRPWKHENGVVASTLHQCLKYYRGGERRINGDVKPFSKVDSFFADAKFFEESGTSSEFLPSTISSTGTRGKEKEAVNSPNTSSNDAKMEVGQSSQSKSNEKVKHVEEAKKEDPQKNAAPVLRYIPKSRRKEGESPFAKYQSSKTMTKEKAKSNNVVKQEWMVKLITPLPSTVEKQVIRYAPTGFVPSSSESSQGQEKGVFNSNAYKLLAKAGYDFENPTPLGKIISVEPYGLNETQKKLFKEEGSFSASKVGLGYESPSPIKIGAQRKLDALSSQCITPEEMTEDESTNETTSPTLSVFDQIRPPATRVALSVFDRLGGHSLSQQEIPLRNRFSIFKRLGVQNNATCACQSSTSSHLKKKGSVLKHLGVSSRSVFDRLKDPKGIEDHKQSHQASASNKEEVKVSNDLRSVVPSRMKRIEVVDIVQAQPFKVKRHVVVLTNQKKSSSFQEKRKSRLGEASTTPSASNKEELEDKIMTSCHITVEEVPDASEEIEADEAPALLEDGGQSTVDDLKELNLGTSEDPRPIYTSALLTEKEEDEYFKLLTEYKDVFAWSYKEMPGLSPKVAMHRLAIKKSVSPKKQPQRRFRSDLIPEIEKEVNKLIEAGFIREVTYPTWIANIVPVRKKNGQLRVCVDFRDLNNACPKDDFPLPVTELMIDATTGHEALSFMDCTAGYNQILMAPEDQEATAFRTPKGIFCYKVMPFGLKNAGATYQRAMQRIFDDMLHKKIECHVDDVVVKSKKREDHINDLRTVFERLRKCQLKMNPLKCAFGVTSGKFLGFVVRHRGIEVDQSKIKAIQEMPEPKNLKELRGLQGRLAYIRRFISNLAGRCQPFSHLMKKDAIFQWDDKCHNAFESIKKYLSSAPVLGAPPSGRPFILYIAAQERSLGALCAQENEDKKERALYYLSRTLVGAELNYSQIEKICLALVFAIQKLRHYMQAHTVHVISKDDPIKYILSRPVLSGRLAKWALLLKQDDLVHVPQKAIKGQALVTSLLIIQVPKWELQDDLPGEEIFYVDVLPPWQMYFDEYQALILGLQMAIEIGVKDLDIYGDSLLVVNQVLDEFEVKKDDLIPYHQYAIRLLNKLDCVHIGHVPRNANKLADALANLAATLALKGEGSHDNSICKSLGSTAARTAARRRRNCRVI